MKENIKGWTESVTILAGFAPKHPQSAYAGLQKFLKKEVGFRAEGYPGVGESFGPVEEALKETFVLEFLKGLREGLLELGITRLPVK